MNKLEQPDLSDARKLKIFAARKLPWSKQPDYARQARSETLRPENTRNTSSPRARLTAGMTLARGIFFLATLAVLVMGVWAGILHTWYFA